MTDSTASDTATATTFPPGAPCWTDLATSDPDRAENFYGEVLGWTARHQGEEFGGYVSLYSDGDFVAGMIGNPPDSGFPDAWTLYLTCEDARRTVGEVADAGGRVVIPARDVMDLGVMALVADPGGATVGLWQPGTHRGFAATARVGAPVWHELHTRDHADAVRFYERVFGWTTEVMSDTEEFRYTLSVDAQGTQRAGVMDATQYRPEGMPGVWQTYWGVSDVDAALATVQRLGGQVVDPAEDTPHGRLATVTDPTGASFKLSSVRA
jgi:predicted enzyme related to lactoylglutathione lyase